MITFALKSSFKADDIISYSDLVAVEGINLQRGMNFCVKPYYSIFLMSVRENAPYADEWDEKTDTLIYEGYDAQSNWVEEPKISDQPMHTPKGSLTENGKFYVAQMFRSKNIITK